MSTGYPEQPEAQQPTPDQAPAPAPTFEQGLEEITQQNQPVHPQPSVRQAFADRGYDVSQFQDDATFVQALEQGLATIPQMQGPMDQMQNAWLHPQQQAAMKIHLAAGMISAVIRQRKSQRMKVPF